MHVSKSKRCFNEKSSTYYFHMKSKILADFQISNFTFDVFKIYLLKLPKILIPFKIQQVLNSLLEPDSYAITFVIIILDMIFWILFIPCVFTTSKYGKSKPYKNIHNMQPPLYNDITKIVVDEGS